MFDKFFIFLLILYDFKFLFYIQVNSHLLIPYLDMYWFFIK